MQITRGALLARGLGAAFTLAFAGAFTPSAGAALGDEDLAWARVAVAWDLLLIAFYRRALSSRRLPPAPARLLREALADEGEHYHAAARMLTAAGSTPAVAADFEYAFPGGSFASADRIAALGLRLESACLRSHLGATQAVADAGLRFTMAQAATAAAAHAGLLAALAPGALPGAFPVPLDLAGASAAQAPYLG